MKGVFVDFWTDTLDNLAELSESSNVTRNELIRRGSEAALVLYGTSKSGIGEILLEELKESERILSNRPVNSTKLIKSLANSTDLSSVLSAIYAVNDGKEEGSIVRLYFRTIQMHLEAISSPNYARREEDYETIREDVISFRNILAKLLKAKSELQNSSVAENRITNTQYTKQPSYHDTKEHANQPRESLEQLQSRPNPKKGK